MESPSMKYFSDQGRGASCMRTPMEPQIRLIVESEAQLAKVREAVCGAMVHREADTGVKYVRVAFRYRDEEEDIPDIDLFGRLPHAIARKIAEPLRVEVVQFPRPRPKSGMMAVRNPISSNWPNRATHGRGPEVEEEVSCRDCASLCSAGILESQPCRRSL